MLRVLHAPINVGNQPWVLSRHERALGVRSDLVVNYPTWLQYPADVCLGRLGDRSWAARARRLRFALWRPGVTTSCIITSASRFSAGERVASPTGDGSSNCGWRSSWAAAADDLAGMRRPTQRPLRGPKRNHHVPCRVHANRRPHAAAEQDHARRILIDRILPDMDRVFVLNPELAHDVPRAEFLPYACVDVEAAERGPAEDRPARSRSSMPRAIPAKKGTRFVVDAVERLQRRASHPLRASLEPAPRRGHETLCPGRPGDRPTPGRLVRRLCGRADGHGQAGGLLHPRRRPAIRAAGHGRPVAVAPRPSRHARGRPAASDFPARPNGRPGASGRGSSSSAGTIRGGSPRR